MWLNKLKSAVVTKDVEQVSTLLQDIPKLTTKELDEASYLLREAALIAKELRDDTALRMQKIKKHIDFLHSTQVKKTQHFDITS